MLRFTVLRQTLIASASLLQQQLAYLVPCHLCPGVLLVASEGLHHSVFRRSVVLLTAHGRWAKLCHASLGGSIKWRRLCIADGQAIYFYGPYSVQH